MLCNKGIEDLHDDDFEGSVDEHRIFTEVFFGNDKGRSIKRCLVTGVINFENDSNCADVSLCSNSESSAITSYDDFYNVKEDFQKLNFGSACLVDEKSYLRRNDHDASVKRIKISVDDLTNAKPYLEKEFKSSTLLECQPDSVRDTITCRLVESSSQGVTSSCYLLKRHAERDKEGGAAGKEVSTCRLPILDGSEGKEIIASKTIASPISQESYATKLLASSPSLKVVSQSKTLPCANPRWKKSPSCFLELNIDEMPMPRDSTKDPRSFLRYYVNHILGAAGWAVGRRRRADKINGIGELVYRSPEGRPVREFRRAWVLCGQSLFTDPHIVLQGSDVKEWVDLPQFCSDLSNTAKQIEEQDRSESTTPLAHWWYLLDPFAKVVFIDKKIALLKAGKLVRAKRSLMINAYAKCDAGMTLKNVDSSGNQFAERNVTGHPCVSSLVSDSALTVVEEDHCILKEQCGTGNSAHCQQMDPCSLPACGSGCICDRTNSSLFEVPICSNGCISPAGLEVVSPHQDSDASSPSHGKHKVTRYEMSLTVVKDESMVSFEDDGKVLGRKASDNVGSIFHRSGVDRSNIEQDGFLESQKSHQTFVHLNSRVIASQLCKPSCDNHHLVDIGDADAIPHSGHSEKEGGQCIDTPILMIDDASFAENSVFKRKVYQKSKKISEIKQTKLYQNGELGLSRQKKSKACRLKDDDLLISAVIKNKSYKYTTKGSSVKWNSRKSKALRKFKSQKGSCRLLPRGLAKGGKHYLEGKWSAFGLRTVLSWLLSSGVVSLNEVILYRNPKDDAVVKDGLVTLGGILCRCCNKVLSVSEFKNHAGFRLNRPCLNLFTESGKPLTLCQLEAWSAEYKARKSATLTVQGDDMDQNDDSCGLCGDGVLSNPLPGWVVKSLGKLIDRSKRDMKPVKRLVQFSVSTIESVCWTGSLTRYLKAAGTVLNALAGFAGM
ncbi:hypothetical protein RJ639_026427 [Escallonia herrerae]|uniref:Tify domain-containing protein n=1 Tax=Escallonia herrerae TaxID=1293975 RepID=A0AA88UX24_9ASTE|nr:hypothetical protein RJ639_026427 [Escallonia herrerae]